MLRSFSYDFILEDKQYFIRDEHELALVFELLSKTGNGEVLCWNVLVSLDEKLTKIITSYSGLNKCLKHLSRKNRFLLFVKIGDILAHIIGNADSFARIMATIPETEDQLRLIKIFRSRGFENIISTTTDLGKVMEWASPEAELAIFSFLTGGFLRKLLASSKDIYDFFHYLHASNKDFVIDRIGWEFIHSRVFAADDFFYTLKSISIASTQKFLELFTPEGIQKLIGGERLFHEYLMKLSFTKQDPLLAYLWYEIDQYNRTR